MLYQIIENAMIAPGVYLMDLAGDTSMLRAPGQFCQVRVPGFYLRRPISVCDWDENGMTLIYKAVGQGTDALSRMSAGEELDILNGLGNGYDLSDAGERPLLIGGGVGIPPLYLLARCLTKADTTVILGFNNAEEIYYVDEFEKLGARVIVATADGSSGVRGFVTDAFRTLVTQGETFTHFYTCGPEPMLRAVYERVYEKAGISGQMSFEERMGCGFGACMGCSTKTKNGNKRICKEGPVLRTEEILW